MNDPSSKPATPSAPTDKANDTISRALEATGNPGTVPSNHPNAPHPAVAGDPQHIGEYIVIRKLGEGGMGAVYLAEDPKLGRKVAIKTMKRELAANRLDRERFLREARAAAAVEHDNIVPIWGVGEATDGTPFIAMPFLQGEMLDARMKREPVAPVSLLLKVAREVAEGLAAAHAKGLIHRDIKPGNVWLEGDLTSSELSQQIRRCKILDFGLARSVDKEDAQITASGVILGTPAYMAPEQARGEKVDHRADLFSLGVMLCRMATGKPPFDGTTPMAVLIAIATETPPPVRTLASHLPPGLAELIDRLMSKEPTGRPQSATEVIATVRQLMREFKEKKSREAVAQPAVANPPAEPISQSRPQVLHEDEDPTGPNAAVPFSEPIPAQPKRSRLPLFIAAAVALVALVPLILWQAGVFRGKDQNPPDSPQVASADRKAAEWVLSIGGKVRINGQDRDIQTANDLPKEPFQLTGVLLGTNKQVTDAGLAVFKDCKNLTHLDLNATPVTDAGLANFAQCANLKVLDLYDTSIGDAGLLHFKNCTQLEEVALARTQVTNAGLANIAASKSLKKLYLYGTTVSNASVEQIKQFTKLTELELRKTSVTQQGIDELRKELSQCHIDWDGGTFKPKGDVSTDRDAALYVLSLGGCVNVNHQDEVISKAKDLPSGPFQLTQLTLPDKEGVADADFAVFKGCRHLITIGLSGTKVGDAGLANFSQCKNVLYLYLHRTRVTSAGLATFKDCTELQELDLSCTQVNNDVVQYIKRFTKLNHLYLKDTTVNEAGVNELAKELRDCEISWNGETIKPGTVRDPDHKAAEWVLRVKGTVGINGEAEISDAKKLPKEPFRLTDVGLGMPTADANLAVFAECKNLIRVSLIGTGITNKGLAHFKECKNLKYLDLAGTKVTDDAVATLKQFAMLEDLILNQTQFTDKGVQSVAAELLGCRIQFGYTIEPATEDDRKAAEYVLSVGGVVRINDMLHNYANAKELPEKPFKLTWVSLRGNAQLKDADLNKLKSSPNLKSLYVNETQIGNAGLVELRDCKSLIWLDVRQTKVTSQGIDELRKSLTKCEIVWDKGTIKPKEK